MAMKSLVPDIREKDKSAGASSRLMPAVAELDTTSVRYAGPTQQLSIPGESQPPPQLPL
jgi:hypothetical protein